MKISRPKAPMPWDMFVFLTLTTVGFGFSMKRLMYPERTLHLAEASVQEFSPTYGRTPPQLVSQMIDVGCLERGLLRDRVTTTSSLGAIRVKGKLCEFSFVRSKLQSGVIVKNHSNGSEGTIFFHGRDGSFTTNDLSLSKGRNEIILSWKSPTQTSEQTYTLEVFQK